MQFPHAVVGGVRAIDRLVRREPECTLLLLLLVVTFRLVARNQYALVDAGAAEELPLFRVTAQMGRLRAALHSPESEDGNEARSHWPIPCRHGRDRSSSTPSRPMQVPVSGQVARRRGDGQSVRASESSHYRCVCRP